MAGNRRTSICALLLLCLVSFSTPCLSVSLKATDSVLEQNFQWAMRMALSYAHEGPDPVGPWYEAALPNRASFCMRDVSHQCVGAHILGLSLHNKNMMSHFASAVSPKRDWCSFWEINKDNKPCPDDYVNDGEFWYVLNANFDVMQACLKLYNWTADSDYIRNAVFQRFYDVTYNEFIPYWKLTPDEMMDRQDIMHRPGSLSAQSRFYNYRGLPSYVESVRGLNCSADLIAAAYSGCKAYATIKRILCDTLEMTQALRLAERYRVLLESQWWDTKEKRYNAFHFMDGHFEAGSRSKSGKGTPYGNYILWFGVDKHSDRVQSILDGFLSCKNAWNIEDYSYMPLLLFQYNKNAEAILAMNRIPHLYRSEYPEASFSVVEDMISGLMGLEPNTEQKTLKTLYHGKECDTTEIDKIPLWGGTVNVMHKGANTMQLTNNTHRPITWLATFYGNKEVYHGKKKLKVCHMNDLWGNSLTQASLIVENGTEALLKAE